ncbi:MAG: inorganic phosphate transporter, partial [Brevinematia bacterium]
MNDWFFSLSLFFVSFLWAINMGASGFSVAFATLYSTKRVNFVLCVFLFTFFLLLGALLIGNKVSETLSSKVISQDTLSTKKWLVVIIFLSSGVSLFISNLMRVPSSTSIIIMSSFLGSGIYLSDFYLMTFIYFVSFSLISLFFSYFVTFFVTKIFYPPRYTNLWFYQKILTNRKIMFLVILLSSFYNAFSIGSNNVPNVVGPISSFLDPKLGLVLFSVLFGVGALILGMGVIKTVSEEIVPIGTLSSSIISVVVSSITILASIAGLPFPIVMVISASVISISTVKREVSHIYSIKN